MKAQDRIQAVAAARQLLDRTQLTGNEVPAYVLVRQMLDVVDKEARRSLESGKDAAEESDRMDARTRLEAGGA